MIQDQNKRRNTPHNFIWLIIFLLFLYAFFFAYDAYSGIFYAIIVLTCFNIVSKDKKIFNKTVFEITICAIVTITISILVLLFFDDISNQNTIFYVIFCTSFGSLLYVIFDLIEKIIDRYIRKEKI